VTFHPDQNLPDCMMPDGGDCCAGHAAIVEDWHRQATRIEALEAALRQRDEETKRFENGVNWPMEAHRANRLYATAVDRIEALETALQQSVDDWRERGRLIEALTMRAGAITCVADAMEAALRPALVELLACSVQLNARKDGSIARAIDGIRVALAPEQKK
jgi:hypothetical protein